MTIKDIARLCGVGPSTVSRAINNDPTINSETRKKVMAVVKKYHFVPNSAARNLKLTESNSVGLISKGVNNPFFQSMYHSFEAELEKHEFSLVLRELEEGHDDAAVADELVREHHLKGIIFLGGLMENPSHALRRIPVPYVLCSVAVGVGEPHCFSVAVNDEEESFKLVDYLCKKGHRRIAIITAPKGDDTVGSLRLHGYKRALAKNGIEADEELIGYMKPDIPTFAIENGYVVMKELLASKADFTAVYAISDQLAFGAYKAILEEGYQIPGDFSVVGFDGIDLTKYMHPSLTTVAQPREEMVKESVELLLSAMKKNIPPRRVLFEGTLLERESVKSSGMEEEGIKRI